MFHEQDAEPLQPIRPHGAILSSIMQPTCNSGPRLMEYGHLGSNWHHDLCPQNMPKIARGVYWCFIALIEEVLQTRRHPCPWLVHDSLTNIIFRSVRYIVALPFICSRCFSTAKFESKYRSTQFCVHFSSLPESFPSLMLPVMHFFQHISAKLWTAGEINLLADINVMQVEILRCSFIIASVWGWKIIQWDIHSWIFAFCVSACMNWASSRLSLSEILLASNWGSPPRIEESIIAGILIIRGIKRQRRRDRKATCRIYFGPDFRQNKVRSVPSRQHALGSLQ